MNTRKLQKVKPTTIRLTLSEWEQLEELKTRMGLRSNSDAVSYLLTIMQANRDDQQEMIYALVDRLAEYIERSFESLNTIMQLDLALNDAFIKYVISTLPHVPDDLKEAAKIRGMDVYKNINIAAVQEFQRRRKNDAYSTTNLGIEGDEDTGA